MRSMSPNILEENAMRLKNGRLEGMKTNTYGDQGLFFQFALEFLPSAFFGESTGANDQFAFHLFGKD